MQNTIQMELLGTTANSGFSLDELVIRLKDLMLDKGLAGILEILLAAIDEQICLQACRTGQLSQQCCESCSYEIHDRRKRRFRTSVGMINLSWRRLRCRSCGKMIVPLRVFLGLKNYQSKTSELERTVVEVASEQSYRRGSSHMQTIGEIPVPKSTAHRWVAQSDCDQIDTGKDTMKLLLADGTGYKRRPDSDKKINNRGEVRLAFGIEKTGQIRPLGAWSGMDWQTIAKEIQGKRDNGKPVAEMLVSDGERGLGEALSPLCDFQQRCHWHAVNDLNYTMWKDGADLSERKNMQKELAGIIGIDLPSEDVERIKDDDKQSLLELVEEAERKVDKLWRRLVFKDYDEAATYVGRLRRQLFHYVRRWIETGLVSPRAASWIERVMREIARRLKRMAFGWSEPGAAKMANIILKRFTNKTDWDKYWKKKLRIEDNVFWQLRSIKINPPLVGR